MDLSDTFPTLVDSFVEIVGSAGLVHLDRMREGIEVCTTKQYAYPKTLLGADIHGRLRGGRPNCVEDFLRAVQNHTPPLVSAFDGRQVTATLEAIHKSLDSDCTEAIAPAS